jgi:hypothetical protein
MDASGTPSWHISVTADGVIYSRFVGPTPSSEISAFIDALAAVMPASSARLVFDLRELGGYNSEIREPMKAWLLKYKLAILELTVIVPKPGTLLKAVVPAVALAAGMKILIREEP